MERHEILSLLNQPQVAFLATVEAGEPRVRGVHLYAADHRGVIFHTADTKPLYQQLKQNPKVELCVLTADGGTQIRVRGEFQESDDMGLKQEIVAHPSRPYLRAMRDARGEATFFKFLRVFRMTKATARIWTMATNLEPLAPVELFD